MRNSTPGRTAAANRVEPRAAKVEVTNATSESPKEPRSTVVRPTEEASGQISQKVRMNGAARKGNGRTRESTTVTAAATHASTTTATQRAPLATKKLPSAKPISPELKPNSPSPRSTGSPPRSRATSVPSTTEMT